MAAKDTLGKEGERLAGEYLERRGYRVIHRNWRCRQGEIDLIALNPPETVFVEVKTRSSTAFGHPFEAITVAKLARLRRLAGAWCALSNEPVGRIRIDAIAVIVQPGREPEIEHLQGVF